LEEFIRRVIDLPVHPPIRNYADWRIGINREKAKKMAAKTDCIKFAMNQPHIFYNIEKTDDGKLFRADLISPDQKREVYVVGNRYSKNSLLGITRMNWMELSPNLDHKNQFDVTIRSNANNNLVKTIVFHSNKQAEIYQDGVTCRYKGNVEGTNEIHLFDFVLGHPDDYYYQKNDYRYFDSGQVMDVQNNVYKNPYLKGQSEILSQNDIEDRKSTMGYIVKVNNCLVSWCSKKEKTVALSTAEAEYMAITAIIKEMKWLRPLLRANW
jgi:hypothetical protein